MSGLPPAARRTAQASSRCHLVFLALALALPGRAADWPMHRGGPELRGIAEMAAPARVELRWQFQAAGPVKGGAAIAGGRVYFGDAAGIVHALDLAAGKELWFFKTEGPVEATPLVLEGTVFIGSSDAQLYALDAASGALKWKYQTGDKILGGANFAKSSTASETWILVGSYDSSLHCIDAATGKAVWKHDTGNFINGTPAVTAAGEVIFGGCDALIHVLKLADGSELRQIDSGAYIASSVAVADGLGYLGNYGNVVLGFDAKTAAILWKYRDRNFPYFSSAAVTADRVILGGRDKRLHCIDRASGKGLWTFQTRSEVESSPVVCGDAVVVGSDDGRLYGVGLGDGKERWVYDIGAAITASPAVSEGRIIVGAEDGAVFCFGAQP